MTVQRVSPLEADALVKDEGYVYVDVRSIPEFDAGHAPGAYNIPLLHATPSGMRPNGEFMPVITAIFSKDSKLVVGCRSGNRSLRAAEALVSAGFEHVVDQRAGHGGVRDAFGQGQEAGWESVGLEVATEAHSDRTYEALLARRGG